jgi:transcriptional regulator with XRE-family HTH domain
MANGYGQMIREARESIGMTVEQLAERLGRAPSTVRRIEAESVEPSVAQINILVAALPLSAEGLLRAMGVHLTPPAAARLPRRLVQALLAMPPQRLAALTELVDPTGDSDTMPAGSAA